MRSGRMQMLVVALMFALSIASYVDRTAMSIAAPTIIKEFGLSETEMGSIFSAFILSYALLMPLGGGLADRFGPKRVLGITSLGTALFTALTASAAMLGLGVLNSFLVVRLAFGASTAPLYPACARMTANWTPLAYHARVQGFILCGASLGAAVTPIVFTRLIQGYGWRFSFWLAAAATAALAVLWMASVRDHPPGGVIAQPKPVEPGGWRRLLTNRNLALLTAGYFALNYFEYIFFYWIYYYFGEIRRVGASDSAIYTTVLLLAGVIAMAGGGWVSDWLIPHWGLKAARRAVATGGMALSAALLYAGTRIESVIPMVALLALAFGFASSAEGPFWASAIEASGGQSGAASGIMNGVGNLGGFLAPTLTPYIAKHAGWSWGLYIGSFMVLAGAMSWLFIDPARRPVHETP